MDNMNEELATMPTDTASFMPLAYECSFEVRVQTGAFTVTTLKFEGHAPAKLLETFADAIGYAVPTGGDLDVDGDDAAEEDV